jgi:hypothetical protein
MKPVPEDPAPTVDFGNVYDYAAVKEAYSPKPADDAWLFHYTNRAGLLGILDGHVWASSIQHLNDSKEVNHCFDLARAWLKATTGDGALEIAFAKRVGRLLKELPTKNPLFIFSLSEAGDQLSQWRAYSSAADAFAIKFDPRGLAFLEGAQHQLVRCEYNSDIQKRWVEQCILDGRARAQLLHDRGHDEQSAAYEGGNLAALLLFLIAPAIKHDAFSEEREWRVAIGPVRDRSRIKFRSGRSMLIPYVECPPSMSDSGRLLPIRGCTIGPGPHARLNESSTQALFESKGLPADQVRRSDVPYRNW